MTITPTPEEYRKMVARQAREIVAGALKAFGWTAHRLAGAVEVDSETVYKWLDGRANVPLFILRHPSVPLKVVLQVVSSLLALRPREDTHASPESEASELLMLVADFIRALGAATADGRIDPDEDDAVDGPASRLIEGLHRRLRRRASVTPIHKGESA